MTEQPNRIGAALGAHGHGLDAIYHRLGALIDAVEENTAALADLAASQTATATGIGDPALTDCGKSLVELMCELTTLLAGEGATGGPPATCPGFPANPTAWLNVTTWLPFPPPLGEASTYVGEFSTTSSPPDLYIDVVTPYPEFPDYSFQVVRSTTPLTNICVSWDGYDDFADVIANRWNFITASVDISTGLDSSADPDPVGSTALSLGLDYGWFFEYDKTGETALPPPPAVRLWIVEGPFG